MKRCTQQLINQHLMDINPLLAGWAADWDTAPKWEKQRDHMLVYYVRRGQFTLVRKDGAYLVREGQSFFIPLDDHTSHTIDGEGPYDFFWAGFSGSLSHHFSELPPVVDIAEDQLVHLRQLREFNARTAYDLAADLLLLRSDLLDDAEPKCDYVQHIIDYIQRTYMYPITVESLAAQVGLDRSYLSRIFKQRTGQTLQDHLQYVRFIQAKTLLMQGCSVKEAAYKCGFGDDKNFHKLFLRREGITPNQWKKYALENLVTLQNRWPNRKEP